MDRPQTTWIMVRVQLSGLQVYKLVVQRFVYYCIVPRYVKYNGFVLVTIVRYLQTKRRAKHADRLFGNHTNPPF